MDKKKTKPCPQCNGTGVAESMTYSAIPCPVCKGTGRTPDEEDDN